MHLPAQHNWIKRERKWLPQISSFDTDRRLIRYRLVFLTKNSHLLTHPLVGFARVFVRTNNTHNKTN
ncbi:hypothetical protein C8D97_11147 [Pleionea mediterranea]|uniref:Uncharacterized protein n=1 Tax=Pleionea mediterranea TaxID=523701 RepID=A0A316FGT8_9GAMM|nr:hypothetical protein C8D97_11147 [Pleionea mediterranea]